MRLRKKLTSVWSHDTQIIYLAKWYLDINAEYLMIFSRFILSYPYGISVPPGQVQVSALFSVSAHTTRPLLLCPVLVQITLFLFVFFPVTSMRAVGGLCLDV